MSKLSGLAVKPDADKPVGSSWIPRCAVWWQFEYLLSVGWLPVVVSANRIFLTFLQKHLDCIFHGQLALEGTKKASLRKLFEGWRNNSYTGIKISIFAKMDIIRPGTAIFGLDQTSIASPILVRWGQTMARWNRQIKRESYFPHNRGQEQLQKIIICWEQTDSIVISIIGQNHHGVLAWILTSLLFSWSYRRPRQTGHLRIEIVIIMWEEKRRERGVEGEGLQLDCPSDGHWDATGAMS